MSNIHETGGPDCSIIIVNYNAKELILRCLESVEQAMSEANLEVIVVDNASSDGSAAAVSTRFPWVKLLQNQVNSGFARANNQAMQVARGRYFLLLNSDAFVHAGAIAALVKYLDGTPQAGAAGPRLVYADGSLQRSCFSFPTPLTELWQTLWLDRLFPRSRVFGKFRMTYWDFDSSRDVDWIMGAVLMLRREAVEQVGPLDESYFMYSEEMDLCYRLKQSGWKVSFVPGAAAIHLWGGSSRQNKELAFLRLYQSRVLFFRKHYGPLATGIYKFVLYLNSLIRILGGSLRLLFSKNQDIQLLTHNYWVLFLSLRGI